MAFDAGPPRDCQACPRLAEFRAANRAEHPEWSNAPVESFGGAGAGLLIVGLASGSYERRADDGLRLVDCAIANAVRCVPPQNKPTPQEMASCRPYLERAIAALPRLKAIVALGRIAHESTLRALGLRLAAYPFAHGARHALPGGSPALFDSYHCSRYNTNTGVLTPDMFREVLRAARDFLKN